MFSSTIIIIKIIKLICDLFDRVNANKKQARLCYMAPSRITNPALCSVFSKCRAWRNYREDSLRWSSLLLLSLLVLLSSDVPVERFVRLFEHIIARWVARKDSLRRQSIAILGIVPSRFIRLLRFLLCSTSNFI